MRISAMPAQVFLSTVVGGELTANAVTSEMESQEVELMPFKKSSINFGTISWGRSLKREDTGYATIETMTQGKTTVD